MLYPEFFRNLEDLVEQGSNKIGGVNFVFTGFDPEVLAVDLERGKFIQLRELFGDSYSLQKVSFITDNNQPRLTVFEGIQTDINTKYSDSGEFLSSNFPQKPFVLIQQIDPNDLQIIVRLTPDQVHLKNCDGLGLDVGSYQGSSIRQPGTVEISKNGLALLIEARPGELIPQN